MSHPFVHPYIPNTAPEVRRAMLDAVGAESVDEFYADVPDELRLDRALELPAPLVAEQDLARHVRGLLAKNRSTDERLSFLANYRLSSDAVDVTFAGTVPLPDYEVLDLSVTFNATELLQIYGRVQNATDETYYEVAGFNTAERAIYGGVRLRF